MSPTPANGADSFETRSTISVGGRNSMSTGSTPCRRRSVSRGCPYCLKVLLENLLRHEDGIERHASDIEAMAAAPGGGGGQRPARSGSARSAS